MALKLKATKQELYDKGFHFNKFMSTDEASCYSIRFPVLKYNKATTVECEITVELENGKVHVNVYNFGTNDVYTPYYYNEYGKYDTLDIINTAIQKQLGKLGIRDNKSKEKK